ncbi:MAG: helix-turn-helix domain-containing protein [Magnetococcales bacterium]|nr:helix-turn-helix domain-containing protein [Magnetococcales bacterium]
MKADETIFLTVAQVAALVGRSERTVMHWRSNGVGPPSQWHGRALLYLRGEVAKWMKQHREQLEKGKMPR